MPMLSPRVWVLHAPDYAVPESSSSKAAELVNAGQTVVLPDYQSAIGTLIALGATAEEALFRAEDARMQPQSQDSYSA